MANKKALPTNRGNHIASEAAHEVEKRFRLLRDFWTKFNNDWSMNLSAALAYSLLMAIFPFFIALLAVLGAFLGGLDAKSYASLVHQIAGTFPSATSAQISALLDTARTQLASASGILWFIAIVLAIFNGSRLFVLMEECFDIIYHVNPRKFIPQNIMAIVMLLLFIVLIPLTVLAGTAQSIIFPLLEKTSLDQFTRNAIFTVADHLGGFIVAYILFQVIYIVVPNQKIRFRYSWPGAIVAAVLLQLYLIFFPLYVEHFLSGIAIAVGSAVILLIFFYYFAVILFLGAEVNAFFAQGIQPTPYNLVTLVNITASGAN
jgi:membrane protein